MNSLTTVGGTVVALDADAGRPGQLPLGLRRGGSAGSAHDARPTKVGAHDVHKDVHRHPGYLPPRPEGSATYVRPAVPRPVLEAREPSVGSVNARRARSGSRSVSEARDPLGVSFTSSVSHALPGSGGSEYAEPSNKDSSVAAHHTVLAANQPIVAVLERLSQTARYAESLYFQRKFEEGIDRVRGHRAAFPSAEAALGLCFDLNDDMLGMIAEEAESLLAVKRIARAPTQERAEELYAERPSENGGWTEGHAADEGPARQARPWETPTADVHVSNESHLRRSARSVGWSEMDTLTDLSGYARRVTYDEHNAETPRATPREVSYSFPSTPATPGRVVISSPYEEALDYPYQLPPTPFTPGKLQAGSYEELDLSGHLYLPTTSQSTESKQGERMFHESAGMTMQEDFAVVDRKEQARMRVRQHLERIDEKVRRVREGHAMGTRPSVVQRRAQSHGVFGAAQDVDKPERVRRWDSFGGAGRAYGEVEGAKVTLLPTLETPGWGAEVKGASLPFDEERIRAAESALGLKSLQEYKRLLAEKTLEVEGLEHRCKAHLEESEEGMEKRDEEIKQFKAAMKEAEQALSALEDTIRQLEAAAEEKDDLIDRLQARVEILEEELAKSGNSSLEKEAEYREHIQALNESIAQLGAAVKEKDSSIASLQDKTAELEDELSETEVQLEASKTALADAQNAIAGKDEKVEALEKELISTKDLLQGQMELYKNEISSSLENTTQLMDLMSKEKDNLIATLNAKVSMLEQTLSEVEEEQKRGLVEHGERERELTDKIQSLALELKVKDKLIAGAKISSKKTPKAGHGSRRSGRKVTPDRPKNRHSQRRHRAHHQHRMLDGFQVPPERDYMAGRYYTDEEAVYDGRMMYPSADDSIFEFSS
ncbi:hypothetical protein ACHAXT_011490 [Thalassiosira profunda]